MKKIITYGLIITAAVIFISFCGGKGPAVSEPFTFSPEKPVPGEVITITYIPEKEEFKVASKVTMLAYTYKTNLPKVTGVTLEKNKESWKAKFTTDAEARGLVIKFKAGEDIDNNHKKGFIVPLYTPDGALVPGSKAGMAEAYSVWGGIAGIERDNEKALNEFETEFKANPEIQLEYLSSYLRALSSLKKEGWENTALAVLDEVSSAENIKEEVISVMAQWYETLKKEEKAEEFAQKAREQFPKGEFVQNERYQEFYKEKTLEKKIALFENFKNDFPDSTRISNFYYYIVRGYLNKDKIKEVRQFFEKNSGINDSYVYNIASSQLLEKEKSLNLAVELAIKGVKLVRDQIKGSFEDKPEYMTDEEWEDQLKQYSLSRLLGILGQLQLKLEEPQKALVNFEEAVNYSEGKNPELNEYYTVALMKEKKFEKVIKIAADFIREGNGTEKMKETLAEAYTELKGDEGFEEFLSELEKTSLHKLRAELEEKIMDEPAPDFTLKDLNGNQVSLAELKGKTFVIDFWATWCGPCVSSFPAMKKAVEKFADDSMVEFLFVNSWQKEEDKKKNAQDFINKNNYPFHVLLDVEDIVIEKFKVTGIPTKFVVDKNGSIRFKSIGFDGNEQKLVDELSQMIEMVK